MKRQHLYSTICLTLTFLFLAFLTPALATDGALDPSFTPGSGVTKIPVLRGQADWLNTGGTATNGVSLIYGYFNQITNPNTNGANIYSFNSLAKLNNTSGLIDANFHFPINSPDGTGVGDVRFAALTINNSATCDIIIGGSFSLVASDGTTYYNLARLRYNGTSLTWAVDTTFPHIFNQSGLVWAMAMVGPNAGAQALAFCLSLGINI